MNRSPRLVLMFLLAVVQTAARAAVVDQQHPSHGGFASTGGGVAAQTFTVGRTGVLTEVEVPLRVSLDNPSLPLSVELRLLRAAGGVPGASPADVLAHAVMQIPDAGYASYPTGFAYTRDFQWIPLSGLNLPVNVGDQLAVAVGPLLSPATSYQPNQAFDWSATFAIPGYEGGSAWQFDGAPAEFTTYGVGLGAVQDYNFRSFVTPEPVGGIVMLLGAALLHAGRRRLTRTRSFTFDGARAARQA